MSIVRGKGMRSHVLTGPAGGATICGKGSLGGTVW